jgi:hypothetical protein
MNPPKTPATTGEQSSPHVDPVCFIANDNPTPAAAPTAARRSVIITVNVRFGVLVIFILYRSSCRSSRFSRSWI